MNHYHFIRKIIDYCEEFESESEVFSVSSFAEWLLTKNKTTTRHTYKSGAIPVRSPVSGYKNYAKNQDDKYRFLDLISRLSRFHEFYLRKFLEDLPVNTRLEYLFLFTIQQAGTIRKTDVIQLHLVEFSTGMDIIRRLLKQAFIHEKPHETDKRTKLLFITDKGKRLLDKAVRKADEEKAVFFSPVNENKWKKILPALQEIHDFHDDIYHNYNTKNEAELKNLIASLKYFYT